VALADFNRFKAVMVGMAKLYERELDGVLLDAYWISLRGWSLEEFEQAAAHLMGTEEFMPRPAAFNALRKAERSTTGEAWATAVEHARSSNYRSGLLGDPAVDGAVRALGGYVAIARCDEDRLHFLERRFAEHYEAIQDAEDTREAVPLLAGPRRSEQALLECEDGK